MSGDMRRLGLVLVSLVVACGDDGRDEGGGFASASASATITVSGGSADGSGGSEDESGEESGGGGGTDNPTGASAGDEGGNGAIECETLVDEAELGPRTQDIIFAVDTSASMIQEAGFVQQQMNSFSIQIEAANVDARIVLLADYPFLIGPGICIDPPLGSGGCPNQDSNPPKFLHVPDSGIGSSNSLQRLVELYPGYGPLLRPDSLTHVVVVSDDNSAMTADDFTSQFGALAEQLDNFVFHAIVATLDPDGPACGSC